MVLKKYKIAFITRTKNRPLMLERAMTSIMGQTLSSWIHVIVNDGGSKTEIDQLVIKHRKAYKGKLKIIHLSKSIGMEGASNVGINSCSTDFIHIHDDDDTLSSTYLEKCFKLLEFSEEFV